MTNSELERMVRELAAQPFRRVISGDDVDGYLAEAPELPGCVTGGATPSEANELLQDALEGWIESALLAGEQVPEPAVSRASA
ncbi:MAG TPA: type II toxin-antitoxin system HicB family antitoxin [Tepidiformaceae bacterium]|nr:type II toxin-antitoxin system HicB family antitoxin [Tepidiformaceae bacterium]